LRFIVGLDCFELSYLILDHFTLYRSGFSQKRDEEFVLAPSYLESMVDEFQIVE
jgi:hypothetical protein